MRYKQFVDSVEPSPSSSLKNDGHVDEDSVRTFDVWKKLRSFTCRNVSPVDVEAAREALRKGKEYNHDDLSMFGVVGPIDSKSHSNEIVFEGYSEKDFSDIWQSYEPHVDTSTLLKLRRGGVCKKTTFRPAKSVGAMKKKSLLKTLFRAESGFSDDASSLFGINTVNTKHYSSPEAFEKGLTRKNEFIFIARRHGRTRSARVSVLVELIDALSKMDKYDAFQRPVLETYPDMRERYLTIVSDPMDLGTMKRLVQHDAAYDIEHILCDFVRMCENCMSFNPEGTPLHGEAKKLLKRGVPLIEAYASGFWNVDAAEKRCDISNVRREGCDVGFVHYYIQWLRSAEDRAPKRVVYVATLQAVKKQVDGGMGIRHSESRTGTALLVLALEHARQLGATYCCLDATIQSIPFYERFFFMHKTPRPIESIYQPMMLRLAHATNWNGWRPNVTLNLIPSIPRTFQAHVCVTHSTTVGKQASPSEGLHLRCRVADDDILTFDSDTSRDFASVATAPSCLRVVGFEDVSTGARPVIDDEQSNISNDTIWRAVRRGQNDLMKQIERNQHRERILRSKIERWNTLFAPCRNDQEVLELQQKLVAVSSRKQKLRRRRVQDVVAGITKAQQSSHALDSNTSSPHDTDCQEKRTQCAIDLKSDGSQLGEIPAVEATPLYCVCRKPWNDADPYAESMFNCEGGCDGWFHLSCLGLRRCGSDPTNCIVDSQGRHWNVKERFVCNECRRGSPLPRSSHDVTSTAQDVASRGQMDEQSSSTLSCTSTLESDAKDRQITLTQNRRHRVRVDYRELEGIDSDEENDESVSERRSHGTPMGLDRRSRTLNEATPKVYANATSKKDPSFSPMAKDLDIVEVRSELSTAKGEKTTGHVLAPRPSIVNSSSHPSSLKTKPLNAFKLLVSGQSKYWKGKKVNKKSKKRRGKCYNSRSRLSLKRTWICVGAESATQPTRKKKVKGGPLMVDGEESGARRGRDGQVQGT